eukprot:m.324718 g.324718  ORF g.324718 m.324718 type:complete len:648 (-) comp16013_c0_seq7:274-2217(-)
MRLTTLVPAVTAVILLLASATVQAESTATATDTVTTDGTTTGTTSTTSSSTTSSTTTLAPCVVDVTLPVIASDCAGYAEHGVSCNFTCATGYVVASGDQEQTCNNGVFNGTALVCEDFDSCASNPCNPIKSQCVDSEPPSVDPICVCSFGHIGAESTDGEDCQLRKRITTSDDGMKVIVGTNEDFTFQFGAEDPTEHSFRGILSSISVLEDEESGPIAMLAQDVATNMGALRTELKGDLGDLTTSVDESVNDLNQQIATASEGAADALADAVETANTRMDVQKADLEGSIDDLRSELTDSITAKATSLEEYAVSKVQSLGTAIDGSVDSLETRIGQTEGGLAAANTAINNVNGRVNGVSTLVTSVSTTVTSNYNTLTSTTNTLNSKVTTAQNTANSAYSLANTANTKAVAADTKAGNAYNLANTANTKATGADSKAASALSLANSANSKVSSLITKLGCIYSGCSGSYTCNPSTLKCEMSSLIPAGILGSSIGSAVVSGHGSSYQFNKRCYRKTTNGASGYTFHSLCNNKKPLFVVCRNTNGRYFGALSTIEFTSSNNYKTSSSNYLWRWTGSSFDKTTGFRYSQHAIYDGASYGPTFGGGHDWYVDSSINSMYTYAYSYSVSGYSNNWLDGTYSSYASDLEVFYQG